MSRTKLLIQEDKSTGLEHELNHAAYHDTKDQPEWKEGFDEMIKQVSTTEDDILKIRIEIALRYARRGDIDELRDELFNYIKTH